MEKTTAQQVQQKEKQFYNETLQNDLLQIQQGNSKTYNNGMNIILFSYNNMISNKRAFKADALLIDNISLTYLDESITYLKQCNISEIILLDNSSALMDILIHIIETGVKVLGSATLERYNALFEKMEYKKGLRIKLV